MLTDYQFYDLDSDGVPVNIGERMAKKLQAIPLPDMTGKDILDVGCDTGFWSWQAAIRGARSVIGLDRNREVKGVGHFDLVGQNIKTAYSYEKLRVCSFYEINRQCRRRNNRTRTSKREELNLKIHVAPSLRLLRGSHLVTCATDSMC